MIVAKTRKTIIDCIGEETCFKVDSLAGGTDLCFMGDSILILSNASLQSLINGVVHLY